MLSQWSLPSEDGKAKFLTDEVLAECDGPAIALFLKGGETFFGVASDHEEDRVRWLATKVNREDLVSIASKRIPTRSLFARQDVWVIDNPDDSVESRFWVIPFSDVPDDALPDVGAFLPNFSRSLLFRRLSRSVFYLVGGAALGQSAGDGADAEVAGSALANWAGLVNAISAARSKRSRTKVRPMRAAVLDVRAGSFGFVVQDFGPIDGSELDVNAVSSASEIAAMAAAAADSEFETAIASLDRPGRAALRELFSGLAKKNVGIRIEDPSTGDVTQSVDADDVSRAHERLRQEPGKPQEVETLYTKRGVLKGVIAKTRQYEVLLENDGAEPILVSGTADSSLSDDDIEAMRRHYLTPVDIHLREVKIPRKRKPLIILTLIGINAGSEEIGRKPGSSDAPISFEYASSEDQGVTGAHE